jgi:hypothetical protein
MKFMMTLFALVIVCEAILKQFLDNKIDVSLQIQGYDIDNADKIWMSLGQVADFEIKR